MHVRLEKEEEKGWLYSNEYHHTIYMCCLQNAGHIFLHRCPIALAAHIIKKNLSENLAYPQKRNGRF
jgi:hypothetical protein